MTPIRSDNLETPDVWGQLPELETLTGQDIWSLRREFLERLWPQVKKWQVLEVGSGPAHDSLTFAQRGADLTVIDRSERSLKLAESIYNSLGLAIQTICSDAADLPFRMNQFELAFNAGVLEHFTDERLEQVIDEMIRIVKPGGYVLAFCPNRYNIFYQVHLQRGKHHRYTFERAFTATEIERRFRARGLIDVRVSGVHVHPAINYLLPAWLPKHHRIEPAMRWCFRWFEHLHSLHRVKSIVGQDFVVWAKVPATIPPRRSITNFADGPAVRFDNRQVSCGHLALK